MKHSYSFVSNRQRQVLAYLAEHPTATAQQLADHFEISISTARRDINALSRTGDIIKKYDPDTPSFLSLIHILTSVSFAVVTAAGASLSFAASLLLSAAAVVLSVRCV